MILYEMLTKFPDNAEFTVQPFDSRFETVVTVYRRYGEPHKKYRVVDSSARMALEAALKQAQTEEAW
jgi:hypothetical protein